MEFKEFCKERSRMCKFKKYCGRCEIGDKKETRTCAEYCVKNPDEAERIVSEWSKEHPITTNADKFKEVFGEDFRITNPNVRMFVYNGVIDSEGREEGTQYEKWLQQEYKPPGKENVDES